MTLTEFIDEKIAIALNYRGLARHNPVEILIEGGGKQFVVLVSVLEPDTITVPYNVTWINADPEHEDYKVLMRRVDAEKYDDKDYRGSWSVLSSVEEIFNEDQFFKKDPDPILGEIQNFKPALASVNRAGGFFLKDESPTPLNPIVVGHNDLRMADARDPLPHSHPDAPRTMLSAGDGSDNYVIVKGSNSAKGSVLFITEQTEDGNYVAEWLAPTTEFAYTGPLPASVAVIGPIVNVAGSSNHVLRADVTLDDGTKYFSAKVKWTLLVNAEYATINVDTGVFKARTVSIDTPVTVRATWLHVESGREIFIDYVITISGDPSIILLESIEVTGPTQFLKSQTGDYIVVAHFSDGSQQNVTPNAFVSSNTNAGTFSGGKLTPKAGQIRDIATSLTATFVRNGITRTDTLAVVIKDPTVYPDSIAITGPNTVNQDAFIDLKGHVVYSDTTQADVTATWTVTSTTYATIDSSGRLTAKPFTSQGSKSVEVNVSYTSNGVTVTAKKTYAIADNKIWPVSAAVTGPSTLAPSATGQYEYTVTYSDGSHLTKTPTWSTTDVTKATVNASGLVSALVAGSVTVRANFTQDGVVLNATKVLTIETANVAIPPLRYGVAMFSNKNFTGGPIVSEITQEERDYGVTDNTSGSGRTYTHWTGLNDFVSSVMTQSLSLATDGIAKNIETTINVDDYVYLMWDARAGDTFIIDLQNSFNVTFDGINYRNDVLGNEDGLPGYDANLPKTLTVQYDDGTGVRPWIIVRSEASTLAEFAPRTNQYSIKYV